MREPGGSPGPDTTLVLVAETVGAPSPARRRLRKAKPQAAELGGSATVPVTRLMVVVTTELQDDPGRWLGRMRDDAEMRGELVERGLMCIRKAVAARRVSASDPSVVDPSIESALVIRIGYGEGDELVERQWEEAIEIPREARSATRGEALRPQERMAALLGLRDTPLVCEELILRARADMDAGRIREAALQVRVGLEALLAERERLSGHGQEADLDTLTGRRKATGEAANEALGGALRGDRSTEVKQTLEICERVLRRRAAHGWEST